MASGRGSIGSGGTNGSAPSNSANIARAQHTPDDTAALEDLSGASQVTSDPISQMRSTLAIGELIASSRPTAGSRLVASEIRTLTDAIREESASLRREIDHLGTNLTNSLKSIVDDENERNSTSMRGFMPRRFPVFRRSRRIPFTFARQTARKSLGTGFSALSDMSNSTATSSATSASNASISTSANQAPTTGTTSSSTGTQTRPTASSGPSHEALATLAANVAALAAATATSPSTTTGSSNSSNNTSSTTANRGSRSNSTVSSPDTPTTPPRAARNRQL